MDRVIGPDWIAQVRATGIWDEPPFWRNPTYLRDSPFRVDELDEFIAAARRVYPREEARQTFATSPVSAHNPAPHVAPLIDIAWAGGSFLMSLGADLAHVRPWAGGYGDLITRLRHNEHYENARLELAVAAGLTQAQIPFEYEPRRDDGRRGLDFRVTLGERPTILEVRNVGFGVDATADLRLLEYVQFGTRPGHARTGEVVQMHVEFLPGYWDLDESERRRLRFDLAAQDDLRRSVLEAFTLLGSHPRKAAVVRNILQLRHPESAGHFGGLPPLPPADQQLDRVREALEEKAALFRRHKQGVGLVWLNIGIPMPDFTTLDANVRGWLAGQDAGPNRVFAVAIAHRVFDPVSFHALAGVQVIVAPADEHAALLGRSEIWNKFGAGLNWFDDRTAAWLRRRRREKSDR